MAITPDDIRLFRSERATDFDDGGGRMSPTVIVDGADNNLFDDVTDFDRIAGRVSLRKVFGQVLSLNDDAFLSAYAFVDTAPTDPATGACIFKYGGLTTERAETLEYFKAAGFTSAGAGLSAGNITTTSGSATITLENTLTGPNESLMLRKWALIYDESGNRCARQITGFSGSDATVDRPMPFTTAAGSLSYLDTVPNSDSGGTNLYYLPKAGYRAYGVATIAAGATALDTVVTPSFMAARVAGYGDPSSATVPAEGFEGGIYPYYLTNGYVPTIFAADPVLIHHTASTTPAAVANTDVVDVLRTDLARLEVIGNDGTIHARFDANAPAPTGVGCTADLAAGTVTFTDVSGYSQPVSIRHRIEELAAVQSIVGGDVTLNRGLSRDYPAGTKISSLMRLGDLQGRVEGGFAQQAWTGVWDDALIGGEPLADFNDVTYPITTENKGAVEERWAIIFTGTTTFRCIGEALGEVGTGNVGAEFAPLNPATGEPLFTMPAAGWGTGWANGNVYRFNTKGANAPIWVLRSVAPSLPGGDDSVTVEFRGYVNT